MHNELREMGIHVIRRGETLGDLTVEPELYEEIRELQKADDRIQKWRNAVEQAEAGVDSKFVIHADGSLRFGGRWCVPDNEELKRKILTEAHATPYSVHPGGDKLYKDLKKTFWWPNMKREVAEFVARCLTCQRVKGEHKRPQGKVFGCVVVAQGREVGVWCRGYGIGWSGSSLMVVVREVLGGGIGGERCR
ncbi:uncharacterized protein LOC141651264 [Silene latifolia]|uniref:uncharacterized protein LOC141651264 n=1 Tax=Silene latifolia TaxID=37657 RepID=UPI003D77097C